MASHYTSFQFDDAFSPKRLGNWHSDTNPWHQRPSYNVREKRDLNFIADSSGHLLPHVTRNACKSPWGEYNRNKDMKLKCPNSKADITVEDKSKLDSEKRPWAKIPKFYTKARLMAEQGLGPKPAAVEINDPINICLKRHQLPVICIVGLPTKCISEMRRTYCQQLARGLEYCYINLDEQIINWKRRQDSLTPAPIANNGNIKSLQQGQGHGQCQYEGEEEVNVKSKKGILKYPSKMNYTNAYPTNNNNNNVNPPPSKKRISFLDPQSYTLSRKELLTKLKGKEFANIGFTIGKPFEREKILELLKFAMAEGFPTKGYVIDGFPWDENDALAFENQFYPITLGIYFVEGKGRLDGQNFTTQNFKINRSYVEKPEIDYPKLAKRSLVYCLEEVDRVSSKYGAKVLKIINSEDIRPENMFYVTGMVLKRLQKPFEAAAEENNLTKRQSRSNKSLLVHQKSDRKIGERPDEEMAQGAQRWRNVGQGDGPMMANNYGIDLNNALRTMPPEELKELSTLGQKFEERVNRRISGKSLPQPSADPFEKGESYPSPRPHPLKKEKVEIMKKFVDDEKDDRVNKKKDSRTMKNSDTVEKDLNMSKFVENLIKEENKKSFFDEYFEKIDEKMVKSSKPPPPSPSLSETRLAMKSDYFVLGDGQSEPSESGDYFKNNNEEKDLMLDFYSDSDEKNNNFGGIGDVSSKMNLIRRSEEKNQMIKPKKPLKKRPQFEVVFPINNNNEQ